MIIAIDFDGTIVTDEYPNIGKPKPEVIEYFRVRKEQGDKFILWSCRTGEKLQEAIDYCRWELNMEFDAVNDNLPEMVEKYGVNCRKVCADEYWDDRSYPLHWLYYEDKE